MASSVLNTVYNQYLTTYAPKKSDTRYDTHKRSELRSIYNSMAKVNRDAPLYKIDNSAETKKYVIGIKEEARLLQNSIISILGNKDSSSFNKIAYSSNENIISAKYIGDNDTNLISDSEPTPTDESVVSKNGIEKEYDIEVTSLATPQVNLGKYLPKNEMSLTPSNYSFDVTVNEQGYEFQYSINEGETNFDIQNKLSRLINNSGIHLHSTVEEDGNGNSALKIVSAQVGVNFGQKQQVFSIKDNNSGLSTGSVNYFGLDYVANEASNAHFKVNGMEASAPSNSFIIGKKYEVTLNGISANEGETVAIGIKPDTEAFAENITNLIGGYNQFIKSVSEYQNNQSKSAELINEMQGIAKFYSSSMNQLGVNLTEEGTLVLDKEAFNNAIVSDEISDSFSSLKDFSSAMLRKSRQISLNPVNYVNKTVVAYKNPGKAYPSPYVTSAYAGFMFNSYC